MIFDDFPINFRIFCEKYCKSFKENSWGSWNQLVEVLDVFPWNFGKIERKFLRNLRKIEKKILNDPREKIMETLLGKTEVIWNWCCWYYEEILESCHEIISVKLKENKKKS